MSTHSSTLSWKIPWTEGPGRLQSMGSLGVGYDWVTSLSLFTFMHWRRKWQPTPVFLPGESHGWGAWWAAVYGVAQSWTRLKRLSSSSSRKYLWVLLVIFMCPFIDLSSYVEKKIENIWKLLPSRDISAPHYSLKMIKVYTSHLVFAGVGESRIRCFFCGICLE